MIYKTIKEFPKYRVYENGSVMSYPRGILLKTDSNRTGYKRVTLCNNGKQRRVFVHRLVAELFVIGQFEGAIINHKDGDKDNNHFSNLEWTTHAKNLKHALDYGLRDMKNKVEMSPEQRRMVELMLAYGGTYQRIADIVGVSYNAVSIINSKLKERATTIREEYT